MKVLVAIPAYDSKIACETARSLLQEQAVASAAGVELQTLFAPGNSLITHARNQSVRDFMQSDADRLVFVDSDVAWEPGGLLRVAIKTEDFVGGAYRYKKAEEAYPVHWTGAKVDPASGLVEVSMLPGGFMSLSKNVFGRLYAEHGAERAYSTEGENFYAFFYLPPNGDGEDGTFCKDWRAIGGKCWLDPDLTLTHVGGAPKYTGNIARWLERFAAPQMEIAA